MFVGNHAKDGQTAVKHLRCTKANRLISSVTQWTLVLLSVSAADCFLRKLTPAVVISCFFPTGFFIDISFFLSISNSSFKQTFPSCCKCSEARHKESTNTRVFQSVSGDTVSISSSLSHFPARWFLSLKRAQEKKNKNQSSASAATLLAPSSLPLLV